MLASSAQEVEIQTSSPKVVLRRMPSVAPDPAHKDHLDYSKTDERLIGIVSTLAAQASGYDVKLFTDDTGPASTADGMGVPYLMINQSWRRPAAETTEEKKIKDLEKDLATYRRQEPTIAIGRCEPADESNVVAVVRKVATPLTEAEVEDFWLSFVLSIRWSRTSRRHRHPRRPTSSERQPNIRLRRKPISRSIATYSTRNGLSNAARP